MMEQMNDRLPTMSKVHIANMRYFQSFPRSVGHVAMSSNNWFGPIKGYLLVGI